MTAASLYQGTLFGQGELFADGGSEPARPAPLADAGSHAGGHECITASCLAHQARVFWQPGARAWLHTDARPCAQSAGVICR